MDKIQIQILDTSWSGIIDVNTDGKFPISLTSSIADISKINDRSGSYSLPFKIEATKENEVFFEHFYYASQKNYKDFDDKKAAKIIINGIDIDTGTIRIDRIASQNKDRTYSFKFFGNNLDWVLAIKGKTFQDLPYLDSTYTYNSTGISGSWSNVANDKLPLYSYLKRGNRQSATEMSTVDFLPDYYMYDIIKEGFKSVGYNVDSTWLEQAEIKKIITPFFGLNFKRTETDLNANSAHVDMQGGIFTLDNTGTLSAGEVFSTLDLDSSHVYPPLVATPQTWNLLTGNDAGNFNLTNGEYTAPYNGFYDFEVNGVFEVTYDTSATVSSINGALNGLQYRLYKNGSHHVWFAGLSPPPTTTTSGSQTTKSFIISSVVSGLHLMTGDVVDTKLQLIIDALLPIGSSAEFRHTQLDYKATLKDIILDGEVYNWKDVTDDKQSLLKYLTDVAKVHNLYFRTNTATRTVYIEPRDDFYNALTTAVDWTNKIYNNRQHELKYNSSFYRRNQFYGYNEDSNDKFLEEKTKEFKEKLLGVTHVYPDKFKTGTTKVETEIIAPSMSYEDEFGVITTHMIDSEDGIADPTSNFQPRLLYYNYGSQVSFDLSTDTSFTLDGTEYANIPYAVTADYYQDGVKRVDVAGNLSFKDANSVNGRYTEYHSKTAQEIVDGMTLKISFLFDLVDYKNLDFRTPIYIDNRYPDIEGYWHIQKVSNFKNDVATDFELIKAKNFISQPINPDFVGRDTVPAYAPDSTANRMTSNISNAPREGSGSGNRIEGGNTYHGDYLTADGTNTVRQGVHNLDISTDVYQLGAGTEFDPFSLIRVDTEGNIYFNGELIRGAAVDGNKVKSKTSSFILNSDVDTYLCDSTTGNIRISLTGTYIIGDVWNIKKTVAAKEVQFVVGSTYYIDGVLTSPTITTINDNIQLQYIGNDNFILL